MVIEQMTGKSAVDAGRQAQNKIRRISEEHNRDLERTMEK